MVNRKNRKKPRKRKIVLASGVFDLLHLGHVKFLEKAKKYGGSTADLVVIVARDNTVKIKKNENPVMSENQRRALVESLSVVDEAILGFEEFDIPKVIQKIQPDVIAVGFDQSNMENILLNYVKEKKLKIKIIRIGKFKEDELDSSSKIKQKIIKDFKR
jgi:FAD synthetase